MNRRLYLHIGQPKTGTTALQHFLFNNRDLLQRQGVLYPAWPTDADTRSHHPLVWSLWQKPVPDFVKEFNAHEYYHRLHAEIEESTCDKVVLSSEMYSARENPEVLREVHRRLEPYDVTVVVYVRRQDQAIQAHYNTNVKTHPFYRGTIQEYVEEYSGMLDVWRSVSNWADVFGKDRILLKVYEKEQMKGDIFEDFLDTVGLKLTDDYDTSVANVQHSVTRDMLEFMRLLNHVPLRKRDRKSINLTLRQVDSALDDFRPFGNHSLLSPAEQLALLKRYESGNAKLAKRFLNRPDGRLFLAPPPDENTSWQEYPGLSTEALIKLVGLLYRTSPESLITIGEALGAFLDADKEREVRRRFPPNRNPGTGAASKRDGDNTGVRAPDKSASSRKSGVNKKRSGIRLLLHAGRPKTGTTALQHFFDLNRDRLLGMGILYPECGVEFSAHHRLSAILMEKNPWGFTFEESAEKLYARLSEEVRRSGVKTVLISSEGFRPDLVRAHQKLFRGYDVHVAVYLREQAALAQSAYSQNVRSVGWTRPIGDYMDEFTTRYDYDRYLGKWSGVVGIESLMVRLYQPGRFQGGTIYSDFLSCLGVEVTTDYQLPPRDLNISPTGGALNIKRHLNRLNLAERDQRACDALLFGDGAVDQPANRYRANLLSEGERQGIMNAYAESNARVAEMYFGRDDGVLFHQEPNQENQESHEPGWGTAALVQFGENLYRTDPDCARHVIEGLMRLVGRRIAPASNTPEPQQRLPSSWKTMIRSLLRR